MKKSEYGEVIYDFDDDYGFNPYAGNAGASGSQGDVVEVEGVEVAVDVMEEVVAPVDVVTTR